MGVPGEYPLWGYAMTCLHTFVKVIVDALGIFSVVFIPPRYTLSKHIVYVGQFTWSHVQPIYIIHIKMMIKILMTTYISSVISLSKEWKFEIYINLFYGFSCERLVIEFFSKW